MDDGMEAIQAGRVCHGVDLETTPSAGESLSATERPRVTPPGLHRHPIRRHTQILHERFQLTQASEQEYQHWQECILVYIEWPASALLSSEPKQL